MLLAIPYQNVELSKLQIELFLTDRRGRCCAPILYREPSNLVMSGCSILTPPMQIVHYDPVVNRLQLNTTKFRTFENRLYAVQDNIANHLYGNRGHVFSEPTASDYSLKDIHGILQKLFIPHVLTVYAYPSTQVNDNGTTTALSAMKPGTAVRFVLRIHGLLLLKNRDAPHVRIQHSIVGVATEEASA